MYTISVKNDCIDQFVGRCEVFGVFTPAALWTIKCLSPANIFRRFNCFLVFLFNFKHIFLFKFKILITCTIFDFSFIATFYPHGQDSFYYIPYMSYTHNTHSYKTVL